MKKTMGSVWIMICIMLMLAGYSDPLPAGAAGTGQTAGSSRRQDAGIPASGKAQDAGKAKYIDSVKLPGYARKFYEVLEESTDNDGKKDYLIMDKYFKPGKAKSSLSRGSKLYQVTRTMTETSMLVAKYEGNRADTVFKNIRTAFDLFGLDHPEVFWLCSDSELRLSAITVPSQGKSVTFVRMDLKRFGADSFDMRRSYAQKTIRSDISKMDKSIRQIEAGMPDGGVYEKVKYFNQWLTKHNDSNYTADGKVPDISLRSISALFGSTGKKGPVCLGYAGAMKVLCDRAKIPCMVVENTDASAFHAWNYVQIDQLWYAVDVTRNDPAYVDRNGNRQTKADSGYENEDYLLSGTDTKDSKGEMFKDNHSVDGLKYTLPADMVLSKKQYAGIQQSKQPDAEDYVSGFYSMLEEGTDNDGLQDYLIRDKYFAAGSEEISAKDMELYQTVHTADHVWMLVAKAPGNEAGGQAACKRLARVYDEFCIDHPEVFWLCGWKDAKFMMVISSSYGQRISYIFLVLKSYGEDSFDMRGNYTEKSIQDDISRLDQSVNHILDNMPKGSTAEKVRYINTWLTKHNDYWADENSKNVPLFSSKSISALFGSTGAQGPVCTGYAGAFKVLCDRAGIPCLFAVGQIGDVYHAWNYVQIGQLWYAVDVTWNDPSVVKGGKRQIQADSGYESEVYLLAGSETQNSEGVSFAESHEMQDAQIEHYVSEFVPHAEWSKSAYAD